MTDEQVQETAAVARRARIEAAVDASLADDAVFGDLATVLSSLEKCGSDDDDDDGDDGEADDDDGDGVGEADDDDDDDDDGDGVGEADDTAGKTHTVSLTSHASLNWEGSTHAIDTMEEDTLTVIVPDGVLPGEIIEVTSPRGLVMEVVVPPCVRAGDEIEVALPSASPPPVPHEEDT